MPTYAYACTSCDHRFDAVQSFTDAALTECPQCQGALRKEYGSIGVTFKGGGFYRTDSRAGNSESSTNAGQSSGSDAGSKSNTPAAASASA